MKFALGDLVRVTHYIDWFDIGGHVMPNHVNLIGKVSAVDTSFDFASIIIDINNDLLWVDEKQLELVYTT